MVSPVLLDTDILSEIVKGRDPAVVARAAEYVAAYGRFTFSVISRYEMLAGLHQKNALVQIETLRRMLSVHNLVIPSTDDLDLAAEIAGALLRSGRPIGLVDPIIAATALNHGLPIATGNLKHFLFMKDAGFDLNLVNWRE